MKSLGIAFDNLESIGFVEYQHANLDLEEKTPTPFDVTDSHEIAHEAIIRAVAKMIEANNAELLKQLKSVGILPDQ
ncbi:hypothetical protein [Paenibacillus graminis]|uniref:hypothetical protein n=1 Tax=Paenibacillus graminis TaxID=189425 RepID=UPI002DBE5FCD|nr:hypothetical protein [Paenibacillus graminis]MEC0169860.1 hypothetical protein [Paenibacillus graminis]